MSHAARPVSAPLGAVCRAATAIALTALLAAGATARVVPRSIAEMAGLERAWFTQAPVDPSTQSVEGALLSDGTLYLLTSSGGLQAIDAETGVASWSTRLGAVMAPVYGPAYHSGRVAVIVGSTLHVLDSQTGAGVIERRVAGPPNASPALDATHAFVPLATGRLISYPLDDPGGLSHITASPGELGAPVVAQGRVAWPTLRGEVYSTPAVGGGAAYRFDVSAPLAGGPTAASLAEPQAPSDDAEAPARETDLQMALFFATKAGAVFAMEADRPRQLWRTSVGGDVSKPVVVAGDVAYVATTSPALFALDAKTGKLLWSVEGLGEFVSASKDRVYAVAPDGAVGVLDRATGRPVAGWPAMGALTPVPNTQSDRLVFVSPSGLVQCFHEEGLAEPYLHAGAPAKAADEPTADTPAEPADAVEPDEPAMDDFDAAPADDSPDVDPFDPFAPAGDEAPADDASDDPFADF